MIKLFLKFLEERNIEYRVLNGYENITHNLNDDLDYDILITRKEFNNIEDIISKFISVSNYRIVQIYHQGKYAKNFFLYNPDTLKLLNLDLYGQLSRLDICILEEHEVFSSKLSFNGISILQPEQEFIQYLIKKLDKGIISHNAFKKLSSLFIKEKRKCISFLKGFFKNSYLELIQIFENSNHKLLQDRSGHYKLEFKKNSKTARENFFSKSGRIIKRILFPTGITIAFLGPDGSGKSTIIERLTERQLPFRRYDYFHLKPIAKKADMNKQIQVTNPHSGKPYSSLMSYVKLGYFVFQYNLGWIKHIFELSRRSSLVIFDRFYDDILIDHKRYRYGGSNEVANFVKYLIPRPSLYFVLTTNAEIIYRRKQEVSKDELMRQLSEYEKLVDGKRYIGVDVSKSPDKIVDKIFNDIMTKLNGRYRIYSSK